MSRAQYDPSRNAEGYLDPTAYKALKRIDRQEYIRFRKMLDEIIYICDRSGFEIKSRIVLKDKKTGRTWK